MTSVAVFAPAKMGAPAMAMSRPMIRLATTMMPKTAMDTPTMPMTTVFHWRLSSVKSMRVPREVISSPTRSMPMAEVAESSKMVLGRPHQKPISRTNAMTSVADRTAFVFCATTSPKE